MKARKLILFGILVIFQFFFSSVATAYAHEVYVLEINQADYAGTPSDPLQLFQAIQNSEQQFILWTIIAVIVVVGVFLISISRRVERVFDPLLFKIKKPYGLIIGRVTLGLALAASGYYGALFGPELPFSDVFGAFAQVAQYLFMGVGVAILFGFMTRTFSLMATAFFIFAFFKYGWYMFTYTNYLGEMVVIAALGQHLLSIDKTIIKWHGSIERLTRLFDRYGFLILRVSFGVSLIYASVYAKFLHSSLAFGTITAGNLTAYFHFDPIFIILGAGIIEVILGVFFIIGFEVRFAALFLAVFLTLSLIHFGEVVWPHIILLGVAAALFVHGYDRYTLEGRFFKDARHEPVL